VLHYPDRSRKIPGVDQNPNRTNPDELLPLTEAAQRLGIAYDTARKRIKAGTLRGERRGGRLYAWVPGLESGPETVSGDRPEHSGAIPDESEPNPDALVATLQDEITFLRQQLDHQTHIIAGLVQRLPELPAGDPGPQEAQMGTLRGDLDSMTPPTLRAWLRRLLGR
jgi:hypothetical protein